MVTLTVAGNISREATAQPGNIFHEAMRGHGYGDSASSRLGVSVSHVLLVVRHRCIDSSFEGMRASEVKLNGFECREFCVPNSKSGARGTGRAIVKFLINGLRYGELNPEWDEDLQQLDERRIVLNKVLNECKRLRKYVLPSRVFVREAASSFLLRRWR